MFSEAETTLTNTISELKEKKQKLKQSKTRLTQVSAELKQAEGRKQALDTSHDELGKQRKTLLRKTEEVKESLQRSSNKNQVLQGLLKLKKQGTLPGIR